MESLSLILMGLLALGSFLASLWYKREANKEKYFRIQVEYEADKEDAVGTIKNAKMDNLILDANKRLRARRRRDRGDE